MCMWFKCRIYFIRT